MRSMTGCGSGLVSRDGWEVTVEIRTVNHRFLDLALRLPRPLSFLEPVIREGITGRLGRGHVDVFLTVGSTGEASAAVRTDLNLARAYAEAGRGIAEATGTAFDLTVSGLMGLEGVVQVSEREMDQERIAALCGEALSAALDQLIGMRENEGAFLKQDLKIHLDRVEALRSEVCVRAPGVIVDYQERLWARLRALEADGIDPQRLAQEVALMADRCAVDEELSRLESHLGQMRQLLEADGETGKKMDFLVQEMNRETNTIGSKASDLFITNQVVAMKSEIEKIREQVQNVE